ncbi:NAD(P)-dependent oxidoreductase [Thermoactinospora rubra]|uniref:NAD(P)-dependent oxidoreductase n=1 Tax=Thermoactinospora rubra TaxID=1088767 RepID=UPI000A11257C|nr:NAD(P)-binding domain-containing protein [Thermoactinospora rubra]
MDVTVIGLGAMGRALAARLLDTGHRVTVWNRTASKAEPLVAMGATAAPSAAAAVEAAPLVIVCVLDYPAVRQALEGADLRGRVLVNLTNGRPLEARQAAEWAAARGADYLDGGIMAVPSMIGRPGALILYSGSRAALDRHREALETLAAARYVGADPGLAALHDLALLSGMYGLFAGFFHAAAMVRTEKIEVTGFTEELLVPWVGAMTGLLPGMARQIDSGEHPPGDANAQVNQVALANIERAAREQGVDLGLLAPLRAAFDRLVADGRGSEDLSAVIDTVAGTAPGTGDDTGDDTGTGAGDAARADAGGGRR